MECSHGLAYFEYQGRLVSPTRVAKPIWIHQIFEKLASKN
jgi:hypothetical protein